MKFLLFLFVSMLLSACTSGSVVPSGSSPKTNDQAVVENRVTKPTIISFAAVGDVAHTMNDFSINDLKYTLGGGFRIAFDPKNHLNLRMDIGVSEFGVTPIIMLGEAF